METAYNTPEIQMRVAKYKDFYKYLEANTKINSSSPIIAFSLYDNIQCAVSKSNYRHNYLSTVYYTLYYFFDLVFVFVYLILCIVTTFSFNNSTIS